MGRLDFQVHGEKAARNAATWAKTSGGYDESKVVPLTPALAAKLRKQGGTIKDGDIGKKFVTLMAKE